ncbi:Uncharacterized conserved protein YqhQ [Anaerosphaera aminiphila DSM 21120]|uniref:Uncharacterized conserved protein YqhQ n=1 Tax=Anaerosphaera aminiphila DSM 21120 TaxID=1120995 RepID=A0A1M5NPU7_9FIRM|nr:DUF1385 domain-containing protein [Anaerosphaera aminiphila]SHG91571.1 Uncharacterized conserved protein YqhQ [Anaerosphaera aminiphila DSM 21120]
MNNNIKKSFKTSIGGQALIEGVMMKGPSKIAIAVRKPDNDIELKVEKVNDLSKKYKILDFPIIRGAYKLIDSMVVGINSLMYAASFWEDEEQEETSKDKEGILNKIFKDKSESVEMAIIILFSFAIAALLFMILPSIVAGFLTKYTDSSLILNLVEGLLRLSVFGIYLYYVSKVDDIRRVFEYHGSEHKSIHCYEAGDELTVENVRKYPMVHPRCGTSFLFMVMIISILVLSFFGWPSPIMRMLSRIVALPFIAGIAYEVNRIIGKSDLKICKIMTIPGLKIQEYVTVREPDDSMIEVALESLKAVLPEDGESDLWA